MKYVEKSLSGPEIDPDARTKAMMERIPGFLMTWFMRRNLEKIRSSMGGDSKDIVRRPILQEDRTIDGHRAPIRVRIYRPEGAVVRPLLMFHHGGGFFGGSVEAVDDFCRGVADQADAVVVSVDYHLAPEHPYPEGAEDCYEALRWAIGTAGELGIDPGRVSVAGDSAGGNLAAVMSAMANDRGDVLIHRQVLIYPAVDNSHENMKANFPSAVGTFKGMLELYLEDPSLSNHPYVSPAWYQPLGEFPPTLIAIGELDFLLTQSKRFAESLDEAGVEVELIVYENANHAFIDNVGNNANADDLVSETARFITG